MIHIKSYMEMTTSLKNVWVTKWNCTLNPSSRSTLYRWKFCTIKPLKPLIFLETKHALICMQAQVPLVWLSVNMQKAWLVLKSLKKPLIMPTTIQKWITLIIVTMFVRMPQILHTNIKTIKLMSSLLIHQEKEWLKMVL